MWLFKTFQPLQAGILLFAGLMALGLVVVLELFPAFEKGRYPGVMIVLMITLMAFADQIFLLYERFMKRS
jgi:hypothetical protein